MRRLLIVLAALALVLGAVAGSALADRHRDGDGKDHKTPPSYCVNGSTVTPDRGDRYVVDHISYKDAAENGGYYSYTVTFGKWEMQFASLHEPYAFPWVSDVVFYPVTKGACAAAMAAVAPPSGVFLCYSAYQDKPGVWPADQAKALFDEGYWLAYAVSGNVTGGTNVGDYHLTCNLAAAQSVSDSLMGGDGTVLGPVYSGVFGLYPVVGE